MWEADARTFQMTYVSPQAERILGYPPDAWLEDDFWPDHIHPEDRVVAVASCLEATASQREHTFEYRMIAADGREVWIRDIVTVAADRGRPSFLRGIMLDITAQRHAEEERAAQLHFLESLDRVNRAIHSAHDLDALMQGVLAVTLEIFDCDRAWLGAASAPGSRGWRCSMEAHRPPYAGWSVLPLPDEVGADMEDAARALCASDVPLVIGVPGTPPVPELLRTAYAVRSALGMMLRPAMAPAYVFGLHQCSHVRAWSPHELRLFEAIGRRLTDALGTSHMHRRLRDSEARFRVLSEHAIDAFFLHDVGGVVIDVNPQACKSLGRTREELLGSYPSLFDRRLAAGAGPATPGSRWRTRSIRCCSSPSRPPSSKRRCASSSAERDGAPPHPLSPRLLLPTPQHIPPQSKPVRAPREACLRPSRPRRACPSRSPGRSLRCAAARRRTR